MAVLTGRVERSTIILSDSDTLKISLAVFSQYCRSALLPAPSPNVFVGVLTEMKIISDSLIPFSTSVEKQKHQAFSSA